MNKLCTKCNCWVASWARVRHTHTHKSRKTNKESHTKFPARQHSGAKVARPDDVLMHTNVGFVFARLTKLSSCQKPNKATSFSFCVLYLVFKLLEYCRSLILSHNNNKHELKAFTRDVINLINKIYIFQLFILLYIYYIRIYYIYIIQLLKFF